jgi:hypothetical protein
MTVRLTGANGAATETVLTNIDSNDERVIELLEAGGDVEIVIMITNPDISIMDAVHSLQQEALGIYDDDDDSEEDLQQTMVRLLSKPIDDIPGAKTLGLNALRNAGHLLIWQIMKMRESEIKRIKSFGAIGFNSVKSGLHKLFADAGVPLENVFGLDLELYQDQLPTPGE